MRDKIQRQYADWGRVSYDPPEGLKIILPSNSHVDFPFTVVPEHLVSCGPIVRPSRSVDETDEELAAWLKRRPTVYVNLGTHVSYDDDTTMELAGALKQLLSTAKQRKKELQVLWKLNKGEGHSSSLKNGEHDGEERIRIVDWLHTEPISILESDTVICSVNHGGANSYFEAVRSVRPPPHFIYPFAKKSS